MRVCGVEWGEGGCLHKTSTKLRAADNTQTTLTTDGGRYLVVEPLDDDLHVVKHQVHLLQDWITGKPRVQRWSQVFQDIPKPAKIPKSHNDKEFSIVTVLKLK